MLTNVSNFHRLTRAGLHRHHLPAAALAGQPAGVPRERERERERERGRAAGDPAVDPGHLHPGLQALLPARRHGGEPPDPHLQQRHRPLRTPVGRGSGTRPIRRVYGEVAECFSPFC